MPNGTKITPNPLPIRLLGVGCRVLGVVKKENIYVHTRYFVFLIFPYTLHPTPNTLPTRAFSFSSVPFISMPFRVFIRKPIEEDCQALLFLHQRSKALGFNG